MKISQQPTDHILVRAYTGYDNDSCDFAIVDCGGDWFAEIQRRLDAVRPNANEYNFKTVSYHDCGADFHVWNEATGNDMLSDDRDWAFVELEEGEEKRFAVPEDRLSCHAMELESNGRGRYTAKGKHGCDEYFTRELPFAEIIESITDHINAGVTVPDTRVEEPQTYDAIKISQQPTNHILVKAYCNSKWDSCDFAIIYCGGGWAERMAERIEEVRPLRGGIDLFSAYFLSGSVSFYISRGEEAEEILSGDKGWAFVNLDEGEEDEFAVPENRLELHTLVLYTDGRGRYKAYGKHTCEEFYTGELPFAAIVESIVHHHDPCATEKYRTAYGEIVAQGGDNAAACGKLIRDLLSANGGRVVSKQYEVAGYEYDADPDFVEIASGDDTQGRTIVIKSASLGDDDGIVVDCYDLEEFCDVQGLRIEDKNYRDVIGFIFRALSYNHRRSETVGAMTALQRKVASTEEAIPAQMLKFAEATPHGKLMLRESYRIADEEGDPCEIVGFRVDDGVLKAMLTYDNSDEPRYVDARFLAVGKLLGIILSNC